MATVESAPFVQQLVKLWRRLHRRLGGVGIGGVAVLLVAAGLMALLPSLMGWIETQRHDIARRAAERPRVKALALNASAPGQRINAFVDSFPPLSQSTEDLEQLFDSAQQARLELPKADYALNAPAGSPFLTYTVTLPVRDDYGSLKAFAAQVLRRLPHASLDDLRLARPDSLGEQLEATVRITLHYRKS